MTGVLFLPQAHLNEWLEAGHVDLSGDTLVFTSDKSSYPIISAVQFGKLVDGQDAQKLVGKVKAVEALRMGGAEISMGAVVLGESAYEVVEGYMITVQIPAGVRPQSRPAPKASGQEADLLAQFILNKLS